MQEVELETHLWEDRVILLFAPDKSNADFVSMTTELQRNEEGVKDRDLVIYELVKNDGRVGDRPVSGEAVEALTTRFEVEDGFTYILIGKDGGVKKRSQSAITVESIFEQIDRMPMRQREMRD